MSQLDSHVRSLRSRLTLGLFCDALAYTSAGAAALVLAAILVGRLSMYYPPAPLWWLCGLAAAAILGAAGYGALRRPSEHAAAVQLDAALGLKEKFSTALLARGSRDEFAAASVADAEYTATHVSLRRRFPLTFPAMGYWAIGLMVAAVLAQLLTPQMDLLGRQQRLAAATVRQQQADEARKKVEKALVEIESLPRVEAADPKMQAAKAELQSLLKKPIRDPGAAAAAAQKVTQDAQALRDRIKDNQKLVDSQAQKKLFQSMLTSSKPFSQLEEARKTLSNADWNAAAQALQQAAEEFDKSDPANRQEMEKEMGALSEMLKAMAQDPKTQQEIAKGLAKMGANPEQAKDLMNEMEKAAGDKDAASRLKNMAENLARQANGGKLPAPDALAKMMQQMQQMQGKMNAQQQAQAMAQAAQAMQRAMQQAQQAGKDGSGQPTPAQQQAMAQARQAMKDALNQMRQAEQDARQVAAAQNGNQPGQGGQWGNGKNDGPGQNGPPGMGMGPGRGMGERPEAPAPFDTKAEHAPGVTDEKGKVLAGWFVKADAIKGESKEELKKVITAAEQQQTDEVEQDRIPLSSQKVVRDYFNAMKQDAQTP